MTREEMYASGCLFAINSFIEKGSSMYVIYVDGKWEKIPWVEIRKWINTKVAESEVKE